MEEMTPERQSKIEELKAEYLKCFALTEQAIWKMAKIAHELIGYGVEPPTTGNRFFDQGIKKIACKYLHPKSFLKFVGKTNIIKKLEYVPIEDQIAMANEEKTITVAVLAGNQIIPKHKTISEMSNKEITRAFSGDTFNNGIRPYEEQKRFLKGPLKKALKAKTKSFSIDPESRCFKHANAFVRDSDRNKILLDDFEKAQTIYYKLPFPAQEAFAKYAETYRR